MAEAAQAIDGRLAGDDARYRGLSIDSRTLAGGQLFFALRGPNFDGSDFLAQAAAAGAAGAVVERTSDAPLPQIVVDDSRAALGRLGRAWRKQMPALVIGITGSNGKTTCKALLASCLSPTAATLATDGNLNNDLGVPLMLSRLSRAHRYAVIEMGANHAGEIAALTELAMPAIVLITNAGPAHLEGFGSLEGVAHAKGEILSGSVRPRAAILNADDPWFDYWRRQAADLDVVSFGRSQEASVRVTGFAAVEGGSRFSLALPGTTIDVALPLPGEHNAVNAAAAAAAAHAAGLPPAAIRAGLESVRPVSGRLRQLAGRAGVRLYDDSYNANPASTVAAARHVAAQAGESWFVLGDMGELGADAAAMHRAVGESLREAGIVRLYATGPLAREAVAGFGAGGRWFASVDELVAALRPELAAGINVLVKGSRSMRMERVVQALAAGEDR